MNMLDPYTAGFLHKCAEYDLPYDFVDGLYKIAWTTNSGQQPWANTAKTMARTAVNNGNSWAGYGNYGGANTPRLQAMMGAGTGPNNQTFQQQPVQQAQQPQQSIAPGGRVPVQMQGVGQQLAKQYPAQPGQTVGQAVGGAIDSGINAVGRAWNGMRQGAENVGTAVGNTIGKGMAAVDNAGLAARKTWAGMRQGAENVGSAVGNVIGKGMAAYDNAKLRARKIGNGFSNAWSSLKKGFLG